MPALVSNSGEAMKTIVLGIALAISAAALADEGAKKATKAKAPVMTNAADMKFTAPEGTPAGIQMAPLWGDMSKGAYGVMTKFAAGVKNPLHWHTNDVKVVIVKGTFLAGPDDVSAKEYGPGAKNGMRSLRASSASQNGVTISSGVLSLV